MSTSPGRSFIFVVTFISTFGILLASMPLGFLIPEQGPYPLADYPGDTWYVSELTAYNQTFGEYDNDTLPINGNIDLDLGTITVNVIWLDGVDYIRLWRTWTEWFGLVQGWSELYLYEEDHIEITLPDIINHQVTNNISRMILKDARYTYHTSWGYNSTSFDDFYEAFTGTNSTETPELLIFMGMGLDQINANLNAWYLIDQLLQFKAPNIHPAINFMIAIPLWTAIIWLAVKILLWIISSPLGGGPG